LVIAALAVLALTIFRIGYQLIHSGSSSRSWDTNDARLSSSATPADSPLPDRPPEPATPVPDAPVSPARIAEPEPAKPDTPKPAAVPSGAPRSAEIGGVKPESATKFAPFVNSLGMKFVPVEITGGPTSGKRVLFGIWDTRVQDYAEFAQAQGITPAKADFEQEPADPVVNVSWDEAQSFCQWLTATERASGRIGGQEGYRLPSDHEWSCADGLGLKEKPEASPAIKCGKLEKLYPWGTKWPPPKEYGNYDPLLRVDKFRNTSPVGSFPPNEFGLCDMSGNVWQWCEDWYDAKHLGRVLRGGSYFGEDAINLACSYRSFSRPGTEYFDHGFRCVLAVSGG
jgi:hypothetical protein